MSRSADRKLVITFFVALVVLAGLRLTAFFTNTHLFPTQPESGSAGQVLMLLTGVMATVHDAETAQRRYLITSSEDALEPYLRATRTIDHQISILEQLIRNDPVQQSLLEKLTPLIREKFSQLDHAIRVRKEEGFEPAASVVLSDRSRQTMDDIRDLISQMENQQHRILTERLIHADQYERKWSNLFAGITILELLLLMLGASLIVRYISQRKRAQEALEKIQAKLNDELRSNLAAIVESSDDAIISETTDGVIVTWNKGAETIFGYTAEEALGRPSSFLVPPDRQHETTAAVLERLSCGGRMDHFETVRLTKDGRRIDIWITVSPIRNPTGEVVRISCIVRDITDRKRHERALRESEAKMLAIVNTTADGILTIDQHGTISFANLAALKIFGYTVEEILGANVNVLMADPYAREHDQYLRDYLQTGRGSVIGAVRELVGRKKGGELFPMDLAVSEVAFAGRAGQRLFTGIVRDISERKQAEQLRIAKEAAESANRAKDEVLAAVSHDLRTPAGAILLWVELLKNGKLTEPQRQEALRMIEQSARTESRLIEDIIDYTRILHGKMRVDLRPVELPGIVRAALDAVEPFARQQEVEIAIEMEPASEPDAPPPMVMGDEVRLQQVYWNLFTNAVKFSPRGSQVLVRIRREPSEVRVQVIDHGRGISPEFLPHVFERLSQADVSDTNRRRGLGLGLAIVRHIVELHKGWVQASSEGPGHGATFTVGLPLAESGTPAGNLVTSGHALSDH